MSWDRFEKLVELIKRRITNIVLYKLKDPRVGFVTITKVDLSRDLKLCRVFFTVMGPEADITKTTHALKAAQGFIQREVGKKLRTRTIPHLEFVEDEDAKKVERLQSLIDTLKAERGEEEPEEGEETENGDQETDGEDSHT